MSFYKTRMKNITKILLAIAFFLISFEGVEAQVQSCNSMPEPVVYTTVGTPTEKRVEETAVVRGITVTRILETRGWSIDKIMYSNQETIPGDTQSDETYCGKSRKNTFGGKKYPFMDSNKVSKITYKFSKPVIDVEVFLAAFGYSGTRKSGGWQSYPHIDVVKITTNKGTATLHARSTCGENNLLTVSGNEISSIDHKTTDAKIGITSTEPFTELVLQVIEKQRQTGGYGFFVEICLASIIADASCDTMPNAQFGREQNATATMGGVKVTRSYTGKGNFSNAGEPRSSIYCQSSYSGDLPWVLNSNNNIKTLTYTFEEPVTEAELWFVGMGGGNGISAYDRAKVSVDCGDITLREAFRCNGNDVNVTNPSANSRLISVKNPTKVTDIAYKVTSSKPFTKITIEDSSDAQAAGYLVEMCPTSVKKANIITVNTALTEQTVCDNTGNAPSYLAKATITPAYAGGTLNYELQAKKKGSTTWETITTNNSVTNDLTYKPSALKALAYNEATVRIKYTYSNSAKFCGTLTKYSNEVKLNVNASTTITTQPATSVAYCKDATPTALSVTATGQGTLSYQWYSNTTNNNTGGTLITGANVATYTPPTTTAGSTYYYVAVTGTCGTVTSTVARVQVLTASDIITINTPNYNNINGICNTNSTISAQATIAPDYSNKIKNLGGGNFFAYQLEYRKTPTSPWENYYTQVYSNNANARIRTFSINPNNTPSGATFRVRYTADIVGLCDNLTVYSNEFTYTKQAVTTITTQPVTPTTPICKDATATALNVVATGEGTLTYQWYSNTTNNNTGGSLITGANTATYTPPTTATGTTYYYAVVTGSCGVTTSTVAKVDVLTPPEVTQTVSTTTTLCPTATSNVVSFANYVTPAVGTTLRWYATPTATASSTVAPTINTNVTTRTTATAYVRAINNNGCTSGIVTVTLTVDDTTAPTFTAPTPLNIVCNSTTATTAISNWLGTATATDTCGAIATITNNYNAPADLCTVPGGVITVTFVAKDTFGNTKTGTSTIHLGVTPLVVKDDTFNIPNGLTTQTTISVLDNDSLGGTKPTAGNGGTVTITNVVPATPINGGNIPVLNPENGVVTIPANTPAGTYTITYKECEALNPNSNCQTATTVIKVGTPTITVVPDPMTVTPSTTTQTIPSILNNDKIGGTVTPTAGPGGNVTMTVTNPSNPGNKPTLDPNTGEVTIPGNTPAGTYTITYSYCEVLNPTNCTGTQTLVVTVVGTATPTPTPVAVDDRVSTALNTPVNIAVLANDTLNGATTPNVVTQPANGTVVVNADNTVEYRPHTGFVGTDTFVYEICNSAGCSSATVTVDIVNKLIPYNGMSVNGDGKNDHFHIGGIENYPNNVVRIYNRWGVKVFEVSGYDNVTRVFRGISDGRVTVEAADKLPQGTYYYVIEYYDQNNNKQSEVGWLYIKK